MNPNLLMLSFVSYLYVFMSTPSELLMSPSIRAELGHITFLRSVSFFVVPIKLRTKRLNLGSLNL